MLLLDEDGCVVLANSAAKALADICVGDLLSDKVKDTEQVVDYLLMCRSSTMPVPVRLKLLSGYESVAFGHRLSVPDTGIDGAVLIRFDENMNLSSKFASLNNDISSLHNKILHFGQERSELESLAFTDPLTGIANRRGFDQELEREYNRSVRYGHDFCVSLIDLDHFKSINDAHGHQLGDEILVHFAQRCLEHLRQTDVVCRVGGEEFALILPETNLHQATTVVSRMLDLLNATPMIAHGRRYAYTASAGLAEKRTDDTPITLFERADRNLYAAKESGRARLIASEVLPAAFPLKSGNGSEGLNEDQIDSQAS
ncbi:hypothetical protein LAB1_02610 [Roseibium sp. LAB1]